MDYLLQKSAFFTKNLTHASIFDNACHSDEIYTSVETRCRREHSKKISFDQSQSTISADVYAPKAHHTISRKAASSSKHQKAFRAESQFCQDLSIFEKKVALQTQLETLQIKVKYSLIVLLLQNFIRVKKNLAVEKRLIQYMKMSGNLWIQECERPEKELNHAVVALDCSQKQSAAYSYPSTISSRNGESDETSGAGILQE